jgi:hypothetical protein
MLWASRLPDSACLVILVRWAASGVVQQFGPWRRPLKETFSLWWAAPTSAQGAASYGGLASKRAVRGRRSSRLRVAANACTCYISPAVLT